MHPLVHRAGTLLCLTSVHAWVQSVPMTTAHDATTETKSAPAGKAAREIARGAADALERARERIAVGWCQGAHAINADGEPVAPWDRSAVAWCASGAITAEGFTLDGQEASRLLGKVVQDTSRLQGKSVVAHVVDFRDWNDSADRTVEQVLAAFDEALTRARSIGWSV